MPSIMVNNSSRPPGYWQSSPAPTSGGGPSLAQNPIPYADPPAAEQPTTPPTPLPDLYGDDAVCKEEVPQQSVQPKPPLFSDPPKSIPGATEPEVCTVPASSTSGGNVWGDGGSGASGATNGNVWGDGDVASPYGNMW